MKYGFSQCNFPHMDLFGCIDFAKKNEFDFLEAYSEHVTKAMTDCGEKLYESLKSTGVKLTVHHALPQEEKTESFRKSILTIKEWDDKYHLLDILSFDTWVNRNESFKHLLWVLELFKDTDVTILTEDCPLNNVQMNMWSEAKKYKNYGLLLDLGHMNVRLSDKGDQPIWCVKNENEAVPLMPGDNSPKAFYNAIKNKPLKVYQLHVHNNNGQKDAHDSIKNGTADYAEIIRVLYNLGYDGYVDFELAPELYGIHGKDADNLLLEDFDFWKDTWRKVANDEK